MWCVGHALARLCMCNGSYKAFALFSCKLMGIINAKAARPGHERMETIKQVVRAKLKEI